MILLLSHGADINLCDKYCESPIYIACRNGHDRTVQLLLSHLADIDLCDKGDITGQCLLLKSNIVDKMYGLDSFFSLFVFCQV